ncbi:MAG: rod shape-determining protein RodA, partial [Bacteroidetes bacterium]|nr:rod shape-determining protein RodA [Bacteroidota bacterium]
MRQDAILKNLDWLLIGIYLVLGVLGIAFVYSTTYTPANPSIFQLDTSYGKQFVWFCISLVVAMLIIVVDYKFYTSFAYIIFGLIMLLLAFVLLFGVEINGSKSWFALGSIRFQPAELAKFATCLALAKVLTSVNMNLRRLSGKLKALVVLGIPISLILLQKDVGSALVFSSLIFVLHREGLESAFLIIGFGLIFLSIMALLYPPLFLMFIYGVLMALLVFYNRKDKYPIIALIVILFSSILYAILYHHYLIDYFPLPLGSLVIDPHLMLTLPILILLLVGFFIYKKRKKWLPIAFGIFFLIGV